LIYKVFDNKAYLFLLIENELSLNSTCVLNNNTR
jgi:hypothetical protein